MSFAIPPNSTATARILKICLHEAGHHIVARVLSFNAGDLTIIFHRNNRHEAGASVTAPTALFTIEETVSYLEKRIKIVYAGALAESLLGIQNPQQTAAETFKTEHSNDSGKAEELIHLLRNLRFPNSHVNAWQAELTQISKELWEDTRKIVTEDGDVIYAVGRRLASKLVEYEQKYLLTVEEVDSMPETRARFA